MNRKVFHGSPPIFFSGTDTKQFACQPARLSSWPRFCFSKPMALAPPTRRRTLGSVKMNFEPIFATICSWAEIHGISVRQTQLARNKAGEFDGLSATMNSIFEAEDRSFYLIHAL